MKENPLKGYKDAGDGWRGGFAGILSTPTQGRKSAGVGVPLRDCVDDSPYPKTAYAWYVLAVLTLVYVFSFLDRQVLNLLVDPVRRDLHISDTQISVLIGFAFALFYVAFGIPLGRIADSYSRRTLIMAGFVLWSIFTGACGLVANYSQLALMRMGVVSARHP